MTLAKSTKLKAAVVGCGSIGSLFDEGRRGLDPWTHAGAYAKHPRTILVAGCDVDARKRENFSKTWGVPTYANYSDMFVHERPDIVSVCTWPDSHAEVTIAAVEAGARAVFCEKPLADSLPNGRKLVQVCEAHNVTLAVNHLRRWDRGHQKVRDFLREGGLGIPQHVTAYYANGVANSGSHVADLLRFFFGEVSWVRAFDRLREKDPDPALDAYLEMQNEVGCALVGCPHNYCDLFEFDIVGTQGRLAIEDRGSRFRLWRVGSDPQRPSRKILVEEPAPFPSGLRGMMLGAVENLVRCVIEQEKLLDTGRDGLAALEVITAVQRSAVAGGDPVSLPLVD